jgi:hypothetical protein
MTRTAFFNEPASANASIGGRSLQASSSSSSFLRKVLDAARFLLPGAPSPAVEAKSVADQPYPWLTANIRRNMSARSQRLIRADY